ncbi:F-box/kelch-repeat protein [Raphanus sativus]|uniref:F-box/kelch-repeat protein At5g51250-like isoform X2 n=1 Tax=Raphanus sativus TaxID=3726 RepID=A0A6J0MBM9_RAPSA|nr:F-box/kelch-repeat protein At5g51250-like isoform X2 [Raphanus sativus]KAJ4911558.1 F-box/kelch-repeat protein [Raphanus sativus]
MKRLMMIKGDFVSRKKKKPTPNTSNDDDDAILPYDLLLIIVARVPVSYYRTLSLVSKTFRSMVASPELYKTRSLLGITESCLYVCLRSGFGSYKWYTLSSSKTKRSGGGYVLARVPVVPDDDDDDFYVCYSELVAVGSDIYGFKKSNTEQTSSSGVSILDCKSHTWRKAPPMPVELDKLSARFVGEDGKIYVLGGRYREDSFKMSSQGFDTNTQTWDLPCHRGVDCCGMPCIVDIDGKLHAVTRIYDGNHAVTVFDKVFAFNSKQGRWDLVERYSRMMTDHVMRRSETCCEIDNVLYSVSYDGALRWYDTDKKRWRDLMGLPEVSYPSGYGSYVKLTGYGGGKMMVFSNRNLSSGRLLSQRDDIFCAEIALERRDGDCWGKVEWFGSVLSAVPKGTEFVKVVSVTL